MSCLVYVGRAPLSAAGFQPAGPAGKNRLTHIAASRKRAANAAGRHGGAGLLSGHAGILAGILSSTSAWAQPKTCPHEWVHCRPEARSTVSDKLFAA